MSKEGKIMVAFTHIVQKIPYNTDLYICRITEKIVCSLLENNFGCLNCHGDLKTFK